MPSKQIRDIFDQVRSFHRKLAKLYEELSEMEQDERLKCLLKYMGRHEEAFENALSQHESSSAKSILDTWVQFADGESLERALAEADIHANMKVEEIIQHALAVDKTLIELYRDLAASTAAPRVQELFSSLAEMEENKDHQYARSLLE